jgi:hypothetical protein
MILDPFDYGSIKLGDREIKKMVLFSDESTEVKHNPSPNPADPNQ